MGTLIIVLRHGHEAYRRTGRLDKVREGPHGAGHHGPARARAHVLIGSRCAVAAVPDCVRSRLMGAVHGSSGGYSGQGRKARRRRGGRGDQGHRPAEADRRRPAALQAHRGQRRRALHLLLRYTGAAAFQRRDRGTRASHRRRRTRQHGEVPSHRSGRDRQEVAEVQGLQGRRGRERERRRQVRFADDAGRERPHQARGRGREADRRAGYRGAAAVSARDGEGPLRLRPRRRDGTDARVALEIRGSRPALAPDRRAVAARRRRDDSRSLRQGPGRARGGRRRRFPRIPRRARGRARPRPAGEDALGARFLR